MSSSLFYLGFKMSLTFEGFCSNAETENFENFKSRCTNSIIAKPLLSTLSGTYLVHGMSKAFKIVTR